MKKTIFTRLMYLSLTIIFISSLVLGTTHFLLIQRYANTAKSDSMMHEAERLRRLTEILVDNYNDVTSNFFRVNLNDISTRVDGYIILTDSNGNVVMNSDNAKEYLGTSQIDISDFTDAISTNIPARKIVLSPIFNQRMLVVAQPYSEDGKNAGLILISSRIPWINKDTSSLIYLLLISIGITIIVSIIISYFLSMQISKPIKGLTKAAKEIAKGNFNRRCENSNMAEINELAETFDTMGEELAKHDDARKAFISNVSHDLRTPMTTISGFVQAILDGTIPKEMENQYLSVVLSESRRLSDLVSSFLDVTRYDMDDFTIHVTEFNINEMLRNSMVMFEQKINDKNININADFMSKNQYVVADEQAISRVIVNLLDNAIKFVNQGGNINIETYEKQNKVYISIMNTGATISEEEQKYIFDRFYKTDKSRAKDKKGVGLGLYIVKSIIKKHNEHINIESNNNKTKFIFSLQSAR